MQKIGCTSAKRASKLDVLHSVCTIFAYDCKFDTVETLKVKIVKDDVLDEVGRTTAYLGQRKPGAASGEAFERVSTTDSDAGLLSLFFDEGLDMLKGRLQRYVVAGDETDEANGADKTDKADGADAKTEVTFTLQIPGQYNTALNDTLVSSVTGYLVNYILAKWCGIADVENVQQYANNVAGNLQDIIGKLSSRTAPKRVKPEGREE